MRKYIRCWPLLFGVAFFVSSGFTNSVSAQAFKLSDLLSAVDATSTRIMEAQFNLVRAKAIAGQSRAFPNPTLFGSSEELGQANESVRESTVGVRQEFGFLWSRRSQQASASSMVSAAEAFYAAERQQAHADVVLKLVRLQQVEESLQFSDTLQRRYTEILRANEAREREGDISGFDAQRVRFESVSVYNRRVTLLSEKQELISALGRETGFGELELLSINADVAKEISLADAKEAVAYAQSNSPEVAYLAASEQAARYSAAAAKQMRWPGLTVGVGQKSTNRDESGLLIEAEVELPLFNRRNSAVRQAKSEHINAKRMKKLSNNLLESEVANAFAIWQSLQNQAAEAVDSQTLIAHLNAAHVLYLSGEAGYLDLLDAFSSSEEILAASFGTENAKWQADLRLRQFTGYPIMENK